jgi:hypothetical protein
MYAALRAIARFDLASVFATTIVAFVIVATIQFASSWGHAQNGLVVFERTCPAHTATAATAMHRR